MRLAIEELVNKAIRLELGSPLLPLIDEEASVFDDAKELGLQDYWKVCPYQVVAGYGGNSSGSLTINMQDIIDAALPNPEIRAKAYYIGILSASMNEGSFSGFTSSPAGFDNYLLGAEGYVSSGNTPQQQLQTLVDVTVADFGRGGYHFHFDHVLKTVKVILARTSGSLSVIHGLGFTDFEYVPPAHLDFLTKLILVRGLGAILNGRSAVTLSTDFTIDNTTISTRLDAIRMELETITPLYAFTPVLWD